MIKWEQARCVSIRQVRHRRGMRAFGLIRAELGRTCAALLAKEVGRCCAAAPPPPPPLGGMASRDACGGSGGSPGPPRPAGGGTDATLSWAAEEDGACDATLATSSDRA